MAKKAAAGRKLGRPKKSDSAKEPKSVKGKPGPKPKAQPQAAGDVPGPVRQVPTQKQIKDLLRDTANFKAEADAATGSLREKIAYAVKNQHLHAKAFAEVRKCSKMSPEKLAEYLDHLEHYMEVSGNYARANAVQQLPLEEPDSPAGGASLAVGDVDEAGDGEADNADLATENVVSPQFGRRTAEPLVG